MTVTIYDRSIPNQLPLDKGDANRALHGGMQSSVKLIKKGFKILLVFVLLAAITAGVIGLKAVVVMSRFNYLS